MTQVRPRFFPGTPAAAAHSRVCVEHSCHARIGSRIVARIAYRPVYSPTGYGAICGACWEADQRRERRVWRDTGQCTIARPRGANPGGAKQS